MKKIPNKRQLRVIVPKPLYNNFKKKCQSNYKTVSEVIRDFMLRYYKTND